MSPPVKTAVILGGGPATSDFFSLAACPKFLLPVANRPLFHYLASVLARAGVERFIFCVHPALVKQVEERLAAVTRSCQCLVRGTTLGSGGSLKEIEALIKDGPFWVAGGDLLLDEDLARMLAFHQERGAVVTAASWRSPESPWEMERLEVGDRNRIRTIHRIHPSQERRSVLKPAGLYLCEAAVLEAIPAGKYFDLKEQVFPSLYEQGIPSEAWELSGYCRTIITMDDYLYANRDVLLERLQISDQSREAAAAAGPPTFIGKTCRCQGPVVLGPGTCLADEVLVLGPTAIGPQCDLGPGAVINGCVLLGHNRIGRGAHLERCVVGEGVAVAEAVDLHQLAIIKKEGQEVSVWLRKPTLNNTGTLVMQFGWQPPAGRSYLRIKRLVDLIFSTLALLISAPLCLLIALAVRLDSPGPVIFRQERCGKDGVRFTMYKFRSMVEGAEEVKRRIEDLNEADGPVFKIIQDPRLTRVGRILRDTNLDELPQLWNVLKGEMSLVGPRPLSIEEMRFSPRWRDARLSLRPGMTGLWQVMAHTKIHFSEWIHHDMTYVIQASPWLDLQILLRTWWKSVINCANLFKGMKPHEA